MATGKQSRLLVDTEVNESKDKHLSTIFLRKKIPKTFIPTYEENFTRRKKILKNKKIKIIGCAKKTMSYIINSNGSFPSDRKIFSMSVLHDLKNEIKSTSFVESWNIFFPTRTNSFKSNYLVYVLPKTQYQNAECPLLSRSFKPVWEIYRCQLNTQEESCCCSCNSDAMFEVMKSLYDCYKKKNCDNCNCILCGHLPREERRLGEQRKSGASSAVVKIDEKKRKKSKKVIKEKISSPLKGKSLAEKEQILKDIIASGAPLPEPKSKSEKDLIKKVQSEFRAQEIKPTKEEQLHKKELSELIDIKNIPSDKLQKLKKDGLLTPLEGKSAEQKEKILKGLAMNGIPLPKGKSMSDKKLIEKVRKDVGLPPEPTSSSEKKTYDKAMALGIITPLVGKSEPEKEKILTEQAKLGLILPEGRTASEKKLIAKIKASKIEPVDLKIPSAKTPKSKAEGILTPLHNKTPEEKEKIIKDLAMKGIPLPEGKTASEKKLIEKVRAEVGLPPQPKTPSTKEKYSKALKAGHIVPLEGKTVAQKEKILKEQAKIGVPLPEGRTASEKALIAKVKAETEAKPEVATITDKIKSTKAAGLVTPLQGKTPEQKEKILRDLAMRNVPLPEAKTASEKQLIDKVRKDIGLPPEPKSKTERKKYQQAIEAGLITPLEGKPKSQKERILKGQADLGLQLPEGRSPSEKDLIKKINKQKDKRKKLNEKTLKVLKEGKGPSDECICDLISPESEKMTKESKIAVPLKSFEKSKIGAVQTPSQKEKVLKELIKQGAPLPEPKTASEKKLLEKLQTDLALPPLPTTPSLKEKYKKAEKSGFIVPLDGKTPSQKEKILTKQAEMGIPLPEGRSPSEKALINKIQATVKPKGVSSEKIRKAKEAGLLTPLEGKTPEEKKRILKNIAKAGLPLPEGKTPSEKQMIKRVKDDMGLPSKGMPSEILRKAKAAGLLTPIEGKSKAQKEKILKDRAAIGLPLPEGVTPSEKEIIKKIKTSPGYTSPKISPEKLKKIKTTGLLPSLEGKTPSQKEKQLRSIAKQGLPLPEPKTLSEKALIEKVQAEAKVSSDLKPISAKMKAAKAAGLLTPLEGKTPEQKEKILKGLTKAGIPLPEGKTPSEKKLIEKVREEVGLPPEPKTSLMRNKIKQAQLAGIVTPLEGKTPTEKEKILRKMNEAGVPLPKGRTTSEKSLIKKIKAGVITKPQKDEILSVKVEKAKEAGLLTPLEGKSPAEKEKIFRNLAKAGLPLPEGKTPSEKALINKIKAEKGISVAPEKIKKLDEKTARVIKEGKGPSDECICDLLSPTPSPKLIKSSEKLHKTKSAALLASLSGKTPEQIEQKLKNLALQGIQLPEGKTKSEKKLISKIRADVGLPPEPTSPSQKEKYNQAMTAGLITPLQGKTDAQKEKILRGQAKAGIPLPDGRTSSEKDLIAKIKATTPLERVSKPKVSRIPSLEGKTPEQKEQILKNLALQGVRLPEGKTKSEKKLISKIRADVGLPPEPTTPSQKEKYNQAMTAGLITPLQGKTDAQKEKILRGQAKAGIPLPEGRTSSEKDLIAKIKATTPLERISKPKVSRVPSLEGKTPEQKEQILKNLALQGVRLPEGKTKSEKKLISKIRADVGLPPEPTTPSQKEKYNQAMTAGLITPLQGKTDAQKEKILRGQAKAGIPLPDGRTSSEKDLIAKIKATTPLEKVSKPKVSRIPSLEGKTPEQKEQILKNLALQGIPLPDPKSLSEKKLMDKVRYDVGLPPEPKTRQEKEKYESAVAAGIVTPLQGKSPSQKEKILRGQAELGMTLPKPRTSSEKALIDKIKTTVPPTKEKIEKPQAPSILTPLEGKTSKQQEKILKGLAMQGIPLPEAKTVSQKRVMDKVRAEIGLPPEPKTASLKEKYNKAQAQGLITPLQGKSDAQKEKILRGQHELGLPLPEGHTPSEKALINKIKETKPLGKPIGMEKMPPEKLAKLDKKTAKGLKESKGPSDECICHILQPKLESGVSPAFEAISKISAEMHKIPSKKLRKAQEAGLLTPLEGKSSAQKEKILKGLAMQGIPLPEPKTDSEKKIIDKVRSEIGLPPEPKTKSARKIYNKAMAAGYITPLQGKSEAQKEKILRKQAELGLPLPEGRTPSEKKLIARIKQSVPPPSEALVPKDKLEKAKASGLLTPLQGKTSEEKEKILRKLAEAGLPLPEGKTRSEKSLIQKVRTEYGKPSKARILAGKEVKKTKTKGSFIIPAEEKGKMKLKSKKIGVSSARRIGKQVELSKTKGAITEEFQDIIKTTTCDRGCGCDKKKIRFKHSYVKIRVTSPDISSLCPCPDECVPGVKGGIFTDNEGIKVTVGRVTGTPSFSSKKSFDGDETAKKYLRRSYVTLSKTSLSSNEKNCKLPNSQYVTFFNSVTNINYSKSESEVEMKNRFMNKYKCNNQKSFSSNSTHAQNKLYQIKKNNIKYTKIFLEKRKVVLSHTCFDSDTSINSSLQSLYLLNRDLSVSLETLPDSISIISFSTKESSSVWSSDMSENKLNDQKTKSSLCVQQKSRISLEALYNLRNNYFETYECSVNRLYQKKDFENNLKHNIFTFGVNNLKTSNSESSMKKFYYNKESKIFVEKSNNRHDVQKLLHHLFPSEPLGNTSSLIIVISTSSDENCSQFSMETENSSIGIDAIEKQYYWNYKANSLHHIQQNHRGFKITTTGINFKNNGLSELKKSNNEQEKPEQNCQPSGKKEHNYRMISTDTTQDKPCCCKKKSDILLFSSSMSQDQKIGLNTTNNKLKCYPELLQNQSNLRIHTHPRCGLPYHHRSTQQCGSECLLLKKIESDKRNTFKTCDCNPRELIELFDKRTKEMISKACNISQDIQNKQISSEGTNSANNLCESCGTSKIDKKTCFCAKKSREKIFKHLCPCEQQKPKFLDEINKNDQVSDSKDSYFKMNCRCKEQKYWKRNILCECPVEPEPENDLNEWIDEKQMRKLKSDLTQTISGFKINKPRKKDDTVNTDFEQILQYIAENLEDERNKDKNTNKNCSCDDRLNTKSDSVCCECPELSRDQVKMEETSVEEPFTGIKFHISGKGSASKGLNGILCFELINI